MVTEYYKKGIDIFLKKKKTKTINMLVNNIETFLKKKESKSISMVVNDIEIFHNMKNEG